MKLKQVYSLLLLCISVVVAAQDTVTIYHDKDGVRTDKAKAVLYTKAVSDGAFGWNAIKYDQDRHILMTGTYTSKELTYRQGAFVFYFKNGNKEAEGGFIENSKEGVWTYWYENGKKQSEGKMLNNKREGMWTYWHDNGVKSSEGIYVRGNAENVWNYWHESGSKKAAGKFVSDQRSGVWQYWDEKKGYLEVEDEFQNGHLFFKTWYFENGGKRTQGSFSSGKRAGEWLFWNIDGKVFFKGSFLNGEQTGEWTRYFSNGESMGVNYENGVAKGPKLGRIFIND